MLLPEVPSWSRHSHAPSSWSGCSAQAWSWHAEAGKWWVQLCYQKTKTAGKGGCDGCEGSVANNALQRHFRVDSGWPSLASGSVPAAWPLLGAGGISSTGKCRVHCFQLWRGLESAQVNVVHYHRECSPTSFSLGLSSGFWNWKTRVFQQNYVGPCGFAESKAVTHGWEHTKLIFCLRVSEKNFIKIQGLCFVCFLC